ncbi:hypothetical protein ACQP1P_22580 [Dactylosporangium sp. CA-052675]|uniref:hypothetical protein n=1 Tax=Dactylosporangium sp. CA-052675 TaxID=3239927 RepID=UPI003D93FF4D
MRQRDVGVVIFGAGVAALGVAMSELLARLTRGADAGNAGVAGRAVSAAGGPAARRQP